MEHGGRKPPNGSMRRYFAIALEAYQRFLDDDGWAIASHIALSALMALFPFFIVLTSLAGFFGSADLADAVANLLLATWPQEVARPLANVHRLAAQDLRVRAHRTAGKFGEGEHLGLVALAHCVPFHCSSTP